MYVSVIIGVNTVVDAVCKCARRLNPSPMHRAGALVAGVIPLTDFYHANRFDAGIVFRD